MWNIPLPDIFAKMPVDELDRTLNDFLTPIVEQLPEERLRRVVPLAVRGILAQETPVIAAMAQSVSRQKMDCWAAAKRIYRFAENKRIHHHHQLFKGMYQIARRTVAQEQPEYLVVALDPVNFEKPYTKKLEGVSTVHKSTPPNLEGKARLAHGYPAMTATVVNTAVPAISYANWFSYQTADFISQNREIQRSIRTTRWVFPGRKRRFVMDSGGDDQKIFAFLQPDEFIITATHLERLVEVNNTRLDRWETEHLQDLVDWVLWQATYQAAFHHAGRTRLANLNMGWFQIRLPQTHQELWALVVETGLESRIPTLLTNVPILTETFARQIYNDWRLRGRIEHGFRSGPGGGSVRLPPHETLASQVGPLAAQTGRQTRPSLRLTGMALISCSVASAPSGKRSLLSWTAIQPFPHHLFRSS